MTPAANNKSASGAEEGGVPTRALRLTDDYMYDGWGRRIRYAVDRTYTATNALPYPAGGLCTASASAITVKDATGTARTTAAMYALISHGGNGHGAYTSNGTMVNAGSSSADELTNCHCTNAGAVGTYAPSYVAKVPAYDSGQSGNALYYFDDIVTYKNAWQMQAQNYALAASQACTVMAIAASDASPYLAFYSFSGGTFKKYANPGTIPQNMGGAATITPDHSTLMWGGNEDGGQISMRQYSISGSGLTQVATYGRPGCCLQEVGDIQFTSDSAFMAVTNVATGDQAWVYQKSGSTYTTTGVTFPAGHVGYDAVWSPDNATLYELGSSGANKNLYVWTRSGSTFTLSKTISLTVPLNGGSLGNQIALDPTGTYLAIGEYGGNNTWRQPIIIKNPNGANSFINTSTSGLPNQTLSDTFAWSPDGKYFATLGGFDLTVFSVNSGTDTFTQVFNDSGSSCHFTTNYWWVTWSPDSQYLFVYDTDATTTLCMYSHVGSVFTYQAVPAGVLPPSSTAGGGARMMSVVR
jgi:hypothetical protein